MKRLIPLLTLLFYAKCVAAQHDYFYIKSKYIVIDTVIIAKNFNDDPMHFTPRMSLFLGKEENNVIEEVIFDTFHVENTFIDHPSGRFATRVYFDSYRKYALGLAIDDKDGKIWLANVNDLGDTIHIDKWLLFHNDLPDSIWQKKEYAHHSGGSYDLYKGKIERFTTNRTEAKEKTKIYSRRIDYLQNSGDSILISRSKSKTFKVKGYSPERKDKYSFVLNGKAYSVPLAASNAGGLVITFTGCPTKKDMRRRFGRDDCSFNSFHGTRSVKKQIYKGIIQL